MHNETISCHYSLDSCATASFPAQNSQTWQVPAKRTPLVYLHEFLLLFQRKFHWMSTVSSTPTLSEAATCKRQKVTHMWEGRIINPCCTCAVTVQWEITEVHYADGSSGSKHILIVFSISTIQILLLTCMPSSSKSSSPKLLSLVNTGGQPVLSLLRLSLEEEEEEKKTK